MACASASHLHYSIPTTSVLSPILSCATLIQHVFSGTRISKKVVPSSATVVLDKNIMRDNSQLLLSSRVCALSFNECLHSSQILHRWAMLVEGGLVQLCIGWRVVIVMVSLVMVYTSQVFVFAIQILHLIAIMIDANCKFTFTLNPVVVVLPHKSQLLVYRQTLSTTICYIFFHSAMGLEHLLFLLIVRIKRSLNLNNIIIHASYNLDNASNQNQRQHP